MERYRRLQEHWVYGGALAGVLVPSLFPLLTASWLLVPKLALATLPAYMLHQYEEHDDDRFHRFVHAQMPSGRRGPGHHAIFLTNVGAVWFLLVGVVWLTVRVSPAFSLVAAYLLLTNAAAHLAHAIVLRRYNPGLWTAAELFVPPGAWLLATVWTDVRPFHHALAFAFVIGLHGAILAWALLPSGSTDLGH